MSTPKHATVSASTSTAATQVQPPPAVKVPSPPTDYDPNASASYASAQPRKAELATIGSAVEELGKFADYAQVFGKTAPPVAHLVQTLQAASEWSTLLVATTLWFGYVRAGTSASWKDARSLIEGLKPAFNLAVAQDPTITSSFPAVTRLLGVAKAISKKGVSTKKRKKEAAKASSAASPTPSPAPAASPAIPVTSAPAATVTNGAAQS